MLAPLRRLSIVAVLAAGAASLTCHAERVHSPNTDLDGLAALTGEVEESKELNTELDRRHQVHQRRDVARDQVVQEFLIGRLTLGQAAVRFRQILCEMPTTSLPPAAGPPDDERHCLAVMFRANKWVEAHLPAEAARVAARLDAELEQLRGPDGVIRLPD